MRRFLNGLREEEGVAMTEFAITLPVILVLLTYSIFFTDVMQVRLKALEMARFVTWEKTIDRPGSDIEAAAEERFANLRSYDKVNEQPGFLMGVGELEVDASLIDDLPVNMVGSMPEQDTPGWASDLIDTAGNGINKVLGHFKLNKNGKAKGEVILTVQNRIVPDMTLLGVEMLPESLTKPLTFSAHNVIVYDTWKAWPHPHSKVDSRSGVDPMTSYRTAEDVTAKQVNHVAFFGFGANDIVSKVSGFISKLEMPSPIDTRTARQGGPIGLRASSRQVASFSPTKSSPQVTRIGQIHRDSRYYPNTPDYRVDRSRYSLPYKVLTEHWYHKDGGYNHKTLTSTQHNKNQYARTWDCRGHYYDGMVVDAGKPGGKDNYNSGCDKKPSGLTGSPSGLGGGLPDVNVGN